MISALIANAASPTDSRTTARRRCRASTALIAIPTDTEPMTCPDADRSGTFPRADNPRVPRSMPTTSPPESGTDGSVLTRCPTSAGLGWLYRIPSSSVTTT